MKGQLVGNGEALLWPDQTTMMSLHLLSRPRNKLVSADTSTLDLLWPAQLINEQARLKQHRDVSRPIAFVTFILSLVAAIIIGPLQLFLIASTTDYNWATTVYYPEALRYIMLASAIIAIINIAALAFAWHSEPKRTRMTIALVVGSLLEISLFWLSSQVPTWQPHHISIILIAAAITCIIVLILLSKQYITATTNDLLAKITLVLLMISSLFSTIGGFMYYQASSTTDPVRLSQISANQAAARLEGVSAPLSDAIFTLCNGKYQVIYLSTANPSGLFECTKSGDVYSAAEQDSQKSRTIQANATYLGTTNNSTISRAFPNSYYLYRSLPQILDEDELVLMLPANSEQELIDNFAPLLLAYWQEHHAHNLFLNVFYNSNFNEITSTKDYILMTALETMAFTDQLPNGNSLSGYHDGKKVSYQFQPDRNLTALNELGADPNLYASSSRDALKTHRHISLHLQASEEIDPAKIRTMLLDSLTGGI